VTAKDFPIRIRGSGHPDKLLIKTDNKGKHHVLLESLTREHGVRRFWMNYLLGDDANWSAPRTLGSSISLWPYHSSLALDGSGVAFAAWVNEEGKFIGRWIRPRNIDLK
jgi:hypothetical protein